MNSMTGMGQSKGVSEGMPWVVEIRSVNHKFCDINFKMPPSLQVFEHLFAASVRKKISRGKVDIWIGIKKKSSEPAVDEKALKDYFKFLTKISKDLKLSEKPSLTHLMMGISYWMPRDNDVKIDPEFIAGLIEKACVDLQKMRQNEGNALKSVLLSKKQFLEDLVEQINARRNDIIRASKERLQKKIEELLNGISLDQPRLENEIAYILDRTDISEELDRLKSHFKQFDQMMKQKDPVGRSLDFLIQEINRELNTITSKSQDVTVAHVIVTAKSELEKIREQVQNIE
ncbi:MAG: hypothetical protein ACD_73C00262G0003 [uncultured bacterium]|nr:MAG: hypothetical protein ACD_73C00262G0003 [uncultured bacterium]